MQVQEDAVGATAPKAIGFTLVSQKDGCPDLDTMLMTCRRKFSEEEFLELKRIFPEVVKLYYENGFVTDQQACDLGAKPDVDINGCEVFRNHEGTLNRRRAFNLTHKHLAESLEETRRTAWTKIREREQALFDKVSFQKQRQ